MNQYTYRINLLDSDFYLGKSPKNYGKKNVAWTTKEYAIQYDDLKKAQEVLDNLPKSFIAYVEEELLPTKYFLVENKYLVQCPPEGVDYLWEKSLEPLFCGDKVEYCIVHYWVSEFACKDTTFATRYEDYREANDTENIRLLTIAEVKEMFPEAIEYEQKRWVDAWRVAGNWNSDHHTQPDLEYQHLAELKLRELGYEIIVENWYPHHWRLTVKENGKVVNWAETGVEFGID